MVVEWLENFQTIIVSLAAIAGAIIAWRGLSTWKEQIRWQQDRGLSVKIFQAFVAFKRTAFKVQGRMFPVFDDAATMEVQLRSAVDLRNEADAFFAKLDGLRSNLEDQISEATILWKEDFKEIFAEIKDVDRLMRETFSAAVTSIDPNVLPRDRAEAFRDHREFRDQVNGINAEKINSGERLANTQEALLIILRSKKAT